jgi:ribulose-phosphate 3-epimerase
MGLCGEDDGVGGAMKVRIVPTIFVRDILVLEERLELYEGLVKRVQLDVADENFYSQPSLEFERLVGQPTTLRRDMHLMTAEPIEFLKTCVDEAVELAVGQIEMMGSQKEFVEEARGLGIKVGLAVDLETKMSELDWQTAKKVDQLLVMGYGLGNEKQGFNKEALEKVKWLREKGFKGEVCVDGGVNEKTIGGCVKAGADVLAVGRGLWQAKDIGKEYERLGRLAEAAVKS